MQSYKVQKFSRNRLKKSFKNVGTYGGVADSLLAAAENFRRGYTILVLDLEKIFEGVRIRAEELKNSKYAL